jgi:hypothetical protein
MHHKLFSCVTQAKLHSSSRRRTAGWEDTMIKKVAFASLVALSALVGVPQTAAATISASANGCGLNCTYVTVIDGHGNVLYSYWDCPVEMECVTPEG